MKIIESLDSTVKIGNGKIFRKLDTRESYYCIKNSQAFESSIIALIQEGTMTSMKRRLAPRAQQEVAITPSENLMRTRGFRNYLKTTKPKGQRPDSNHEKKKEHFALLLG